MRTLFVATLISVALHGSGERQDWAIELLPSCEAFERGAIDRGDRLVGDTAGRPGLLDLSPGPI